MKILFYLFQCSIFSKSFPIPYRRCIDDCLLQTTSEEMADLFHHTINSLQPKLKFETDKTETTPNGLSLSEVQFEITTSKNSKSSFLILQEKNKKEQLKTRYLFTINQPYPRNQLSLSFAMCGNVSGIVNVAPH